VGCPPFWRKDFRSVKNALEFGRHTKDFVSARVLNNAKKGGMKQQRAEYVTVGSKRVFSLALDQLYPSKKSLQTTFDENEEDLEVCREEEKGRRRCREEGGRREG
jgi:hypothetical protein